MDFSMNSDVARGDANIREKYKARYGKWERITRLVTRQMAGKGFTPTECEAALRQCHKMTGFYRELIEGVSS